MPVTWMSKCMSLSVMSDSLRSHGLHSPLNSPGQNTAVASLSLLQGIVPTHRSNPGLPHCRRILYQRSHQGSPRIPVWVAHPFSSGFFWPRNQTMVSCIVGIFFTNWAIRDTRLLMNESMKGITHQTSEFLCISSVTLHKHMITLITNNRYPTTQPVF